ncbi:RNA polymerase, sigma-24 subunit, ECF subfamily OS=Tsukamurella paurometabola (strain ATCC 8368 /DSM / CCUG 35730 / CIP 100753 / JCM 10117 / KCTC 9821/ NBRC 16120 / NCIMB 702349 / NCTC 13040) OX=521096 GN=Tpau_3078 PE=3 SV=1 [Tsukamurella paurometabola]|uniref:RNA polymerase, sigma-24 subunit, ECF subfamily n=1 Tax=Tsukamurella paurometabola (strain ATCC 8368 / DSM 20162 / CCUG 35730 / CIP 100753 / JCM 10117 / KCTC 9821 / NBRC 16120 / NCIMB 702349 / NCTC 13040) TaxID=521096 RepID=D5UUV2_TSUPD|nr:sigma-70 family RNA polymerase sigma factor [Tsukamurella paurometabola]ADG79670.1 RNA polymerase, sigma-24 subunit, ECF subfamily [Tsukamurella paurometabola DSM 20162]SUP36692.1 Sigma-K factor [Tsukamurella paurometabola]
MSIDETGDRALLARAGTGDADAFAAIYDRHIRPVYWQAYAVLRDADAAQEVGQDTFLTLWRRIEEVRVVDESVLPWLLATARYTALNAGRRLSVVRDRSAPLDGDGSVADPAPSPEDALLASEVRHRIDSAVAALSPIDQRLYHLCVEGERTYDSAANELGVTHAAVRNRVSRLRTRLRADLSTLREQS